MSPPASERSPAAHPLTRPPRTRDGTVDLDAIAAALAPADVLETAPGHGGWSYVVPHLGDRLVDDGVRSRWLAPDGTSTAAGDDPFAAIDRWCDRHAISPHGELDPSLPPFTGGLVGAFAYDLGRRVERLPVIAALDGAPHLSLRTVDLLVAVTPGRDRAVIVTRTPLTDRTGGDDASRVAWLTARLEDARVENGRTEDARAGAAPSRWTTTGSSPGSSVGSSAVTTSLPRPDYLAAVERVLEHVAAGDTFQVNLTQRLSAWSEMPLEVLHRRFRDASPAPHAALLPDIGVTSVSPETFLAVAAGSVASRPIKGTRPRHRDPALDAAAADDLATSAKDRAENVMIVDLVRNDLGRVCTAGSVHVPRLCVVEGHPTVWHLVSEVTGRLGPTVGYGDLLRASFPCGSITGTPKVAAMTVIETLEPVRRGWYCGAIGYLGDGAASLSVAIRTATRHPDGRIDHGVGGGIVADSDPADEHAESLDKAAAFLRAVDGRLTAPAGR